MSKLYSQEAISNLTVTMRDVLEDHPDWTPLPYDPTLSDLLPSFPEPSDPDPFVVIAVRNANGVVEVNRIVIGPIPNPSPNICSTCPLKGS